MKERILFFVEKAKSIYRKQRAKFIGIHWYKYSDKNAITINNNSFKIISNYAEFADFIRRHSMNDKIIYKERFSLGDKFVCLFNDEAILCYGWLCMRNCFYVAEIEKNVVNDGQVILYACVTPEQFRNKGLYSELLIKVGEYYASVPLDVFVFASKNNKPSIKALENVGFEKITYKIIK